MRLEKTREFIIKNLQSKCLNSSYYHGVEHSIEVEEACILICAKSEKIANKDIELLRIAALSHDIGHSENKIGHEILGCNFITKNLPEFGYSNADILLINNLILATKFPHNPKTILEEIICDADLSYIGSGLYYEQVARLKKESIELHHLNFETEEKWLEYQLSFLKEHTFFTKYAKNNYNPKKKKIIKEITNKLTSYIKN